MTNTTDQTHNMLEHVSRVMAAYVNAHKLSLDGMSHAITRIYQVFKVIENNPHTVNSRPKEPWPTHTKTLI